MRRQINLAFKLYYKRRFDYVSHMMAQPHSFQARVFESLMQRVTQTEWGKKHGLSPTTSQRLFPTLVPVQEYEMLQPCIHRMMLGEPDVLWPGRVQWCSESSGTTNAKSKFIPVSTENLKECHIRGTWDTMAFFYHNRPDSRAFEARSMIMGGSLQTFSPSEGESFF